MTDQDLELSESLAEMARKLLGQPGGGRRALALARAVAGKGHHRQAAALERLLLEQGDAALTARWRSVQQARAPANQFLLINNAVRSSAYRRALKRQIQPGERVLDIGTGSALLALLAAEAGAARVIACEHQALMAAVAAEIVRDNGYQEIIDVIAKPLEDLRLGHEVPEPVDWIVADLFTGSLLEAGGLRLIAQARRRFLKPAGGVIPASGTVIGCLVGGAELEDLCRVDDSSGFDLRRFNLFSPAVVPLPPERWRQLDYRKFSPAQAIARFDFNTLDGFSPNSRVRRFDISSDGVLTGLMQWVRIELTEGIVLEANDDSELNWMRYLHVFPQPCTVRAGQRFELQVAHDLRSLSVWPLEEQSPGQSFRP